MIPALHEDWKVYMPHKEANLCTAQGGELLCNYFRNLLLGFVFPTVFYSGIGTKVVST
jgi:hypothetical protein